MKHNGGLEMINFNEPPYMEKSMDLFFASLFCIKLQKVFVGCCTYIL